MSLEALVIEWRDARLEWFAWDHRSQTKWKTMPDPQQKILERMGRAEASLMAAARELESK